MDSDAHNELETKAGILLDAVVTHGEMIFALEAFKEADTSGSRQRRERLVRITGVTGRAQ